MSRPTPPLPTPPDHGAARRRIRVSDDRLGSARGGVARRWRRSRARPRRDRRRGRGVRRGDQSGGGTGSAARRWAEVFHRPASSFDVAVGRGPVVGRPSRLRCSGRLLDEGRPDDKAEAYYAPRADRPRVGGGGDGGPTIDGMNAAGFAASAQLRAVTPGGSLFVPAALRALVDVASTGPGGAGPGPSSALLRPRPPPRPRPASPLPPPRSHRRRWTSCSPSSTRWWALPR